MIRTSDFSYLSLQANDFETKKKEGIYWFTLLNPKLLGLASCWWLKNVDDDPEHGIEIFNSCPDDGRQAILETPHSGRLVALVAAPEDVNIILKKEVESFNKIVEESLKKLIDLEVLEADSFFTL